MPRRSCTALRISGPRAAAPEAARSTVATASGLAPSAAASPAHIVGGPVRSVTPCSTTAAKAASASNRSINTMVDPAISPPSRTTFRPKMWKRGSTARATSSGPRRRPSEACTCSRLASRLPWVSIAARGEPAVPLVNISTARSAASRSTAAAGSCAASSATRSGPMTCSSTGRSVRSSASQTVIPWGPQTTARAPTAASSPASSGTGLPGLRGTPTKPPRAAASQPRTNSTVLAATMPMRSPTSRPRSAKPAWSPATSRRSCP